MSRRALITLLGGGGSRCRLAVRGERRRIHWVSENRCANIETSIRPKRDDFLWQ
jgi:hypothetical protein